MSIVKYSPALWTLDGGILKPVVNKPVEIGYDENGVDVTLFGVSAGVYCLWDASADELVITGSSRIEFSGDFNIGLTADTDLIQGTSNLLTINGDLTITGNARFPEFLFHTGDEDTYIKFGTNRVQINSGGTRTVDVVSGQVGIGTATPSAKLDVVGNSEFNGSTVTTDYVRIGTGTTFESFYQQEGDLYSENGKCFWGNGMNARAETYGIGLQIRESTPAKTLTYNINATFTGATQVIYKAGETFVSDGVVAGDFVILTSSDPDLTGATGRATLVTEETITISSGASGGAAFLDLTDVNFIVYNAPITAFLDNGDSYITIGESDDAGFHITSPYGNNNQAVEFIGTAGSHGHSGFSMVLDANDKLGVGGFSLAYDATAFDSSTTLGQGYRTLVDNLGATAGDFHGFELSVSDESNTDLEVEALVTNPGVDPVAQYLSDSATVAKGYVYDASLTTYTDRTTEFGSSGSNVQIFVENNDQILLASLSKWDIVSVALAVDSSQNIVPLFEYIEDDGDWIPFAAADETNGFKQSGSIRWNKDDLTTWGQRTVNEVTGDVGAVDYYWVRITRNRASIGPNLPTESTITIKTLGDKFAWNKTGDINCNTVAVQDGITTPSTITGQGIIYIDSADGDLKIKFGDGTVKTIVTDT